MVVQSDWLSATDSVLVALLTSELVNAPLYRLTIEPSDANGLKAPSQVMIDRIQVVGDDFLIGGSGRVIGRLNESERIALNHMLTVVVGIAD